MNFKNEAKNVDDDINDVVGQISKINSNISVLEKRLDENLSELDYLRDGTRYELHDPTYSELIDFLQADLTDKNEYVEDVYVCRHFANEVNNNSEEKGIRCAFVTVNFSGTDPHGLVGFNTTDQGMVYYDPSMLSVNLGYSGGSELRSGSYWKINLEIGKDYYVDCAVIPSNMYYTRDPDCIIEGFTIYW